ncbi:ribosome biogenesis GTPase Der [Anaeromyxobacter diazotrophicus]|uniref:GTPase Der n=1 Tax=Anaeromyxobacter diazotrophicus TaxID=2590199 RepID=A0A7I9VMI8_9BACT|nr:ribosome biogenesis GTPase Der [Anaeromyxobacter diazotrophicus]GEJ57418.1 GTPase Der [Anaeromyxobacter diazotrophicus]
MPRPLVALVGRPNVGKSTLFNRLAGRRLAIVEDVPGVTRDRNYADAEWDGREFSVVDTGGFEPDAGGGEPLNALVQRQAQLAVEEAAAVVLVVDGREGLTSVDQAVADLLRRSGKPLFVAVNKVDAARHEGDLPIAEFHRLGLGEVFPVSAEHARGVSELAEAVLQRLAVPRAPPPPEAAEELPEEGADAPRGPIRLAIVGRPNVGKSTFVNALLGQERFVVSDVPGTTRDAIDSAVEHKGQQFIVTDTAGIRRKSGVAQKVEAYSVLRAMRCIDESEVVACLLDAGEAGVEQDARLLGMVAEKGRALVVVVNKWDLGEQGGATQAWYRDELAKRLPFVAWAPMIFTSGRTGKGVAKVLDTAARLMEQYRARFPTHAMNELLERIQVSHPAPLVRGRRVKLYYVAQVAYAPPTFVIQCNRPESVNEHYQRYVENRFREAFGLEVPLRLVYKERQRRSRPPPGAKKA